MGPVLEAGRSAQRHRAEILHWLSAGLIASRDLDALSAWLEAEEGLENCFEIEPVSSPSGVVHRTFKRADR